jgi:signal transduction histidine kinase
MVDRRDEANEAAILDRIRDGRAGWEDHHALAVLRYRAGHFDEAEEHALRAVELGARGGATSYLLGLVRREVGRLQEAEAAFVEASAASSPALRGRALYGLGTVRCLMGDARSAIEALLLAVELRPDLVEAWHNLGVAAVRARAWTDAQRAFAHLARSEPSRRDAYLTLLVDVGRAAGLDEMRSQGHRIKNLISLLGDEARRLRDELAHRADPARPAAEKVALGVEAAFVALQRYLAAMREEPLELDLVELNELVNRCVFAASSSLEGLAVERRLASGLPELIGDRAALEEVVLNVILNAVEALHEGRRDTPGPDLLIITRADGEDRVAIEVEDKGPGIEPQNRERIFLLGYTTKPRGSGIGLAQVRKIIRAHGGDVTAGSTAHGGARLSILLPVRPPGENRLPLLSVRSPLFESLGELELREQGRDDAVLSDAT